MKLGGNLVRLFSQIINPMNRVYNCCHNFYLHIAKLFYAIASVDGNVRDEECITLEETLKREWLLE